jgi:hypothetical protein
MWVHRDPRIVYDGVFLKQDLEKAYDEQSQTCTITYLSTGKRPVPMTFDDMVHRLYKMSFRTFRFPSPPWARPRPGPASPFSPRSAASFSASIFVEGNERSRRAAAGPDRSRALSRRAHPGQGALEARPGAAGRRPHRSGALPAWQAERDRASRSTPGRTRAAGRGHGPARSGHGRRRQRQSRLVPHRLADRRARRRAPGRSGQSRERQRLGQQHAQHGGADQHEFSDEQRAAAAASSSSIRSSRSR